MKKTRICAIDIETSGPSVLKNGILAIGICVGDLQGNVIKKIRINFELDEKKEFDNICYDNFWSKPHKQKVLTVLKKNCLKEDIAIAKFVSIIDDLDSKYSMVMISDNPAFDFYFINYYLELYLSRKPIHYALGRHYRNLIDTKSTLKALGKKYQDFVFLGVKHDHFPENDAEYIFKYFHCLQKIKDR